MAFQTTCLICPQNLQTVTYLVVSYFYLDIASNLFQQSMEHQISYEVAPKESSTDFIEGKSAII